MATLMCPHCHQANVPSASPGARLTCSHCHSPLDGVGEKTSRWFIAHQNEKRGPYSWRALLAMASRGDLDPDAMLFKENSERWLRARSLHALFAAAPVARTADTIAPTAKPPQPSQPYDRCTTAMAQLAAAEAQDVQAQHAYREALDATTTHATPANVPAGARRSIWDLPWVMEGLAAASISLLLGLSIVLGYYVIDRMSPHEPKSASPEQHIAGSVSDAGR